MSAAAFGARLRAARERAGLTQSQLAERLGYAPNTVARWERGEVTPHPSVQRVVLAAAVTTR